MTRKKCSHHIIQKIKPTPKQENMSQVAVNNKNILMSQVTSRRTSLLIHFRDDLLSIKDHWRITNFGWHEGQIANITIRYRETGYNGKEVEMSIPPTTFWVLNHDTIIMKLEEQKVPRNYWYMLQEEQEYQGIAGFNTWLSYQIDEYVVGRASDSPISLESEDGEPPESQFITVRDYLEGCGLGNTQSFKRQQDRGNNTIEPYQVDYSDYDFKTRHPFTEQMRTNSDEEEE